jgi:glycosyltransferase involved in cell wall biosynthesis
LNPELPKIIVLCPVRNEAWILPTFLSVTSTFADYIIIADQGSTDGSREICACYEKVIIVDNSSQQFNEPEREKLLISVARKIPGPKVLIALDADEILSATVHTSPEWQTMLNSKPGTSIAWPIIHLWRSPWFYKTNISFTDVLPHQIHAYVDDGTEHIGRVIHSPHLPHRIDSPILLLNSIVALHYQFAAYERAMSKQRWYICYEHLLDGHKSWVDIYQRYGWLIDGFQRLPVIPCQREWHQGWIERGIDTTSVLVEHHFWWDWEVLRWLAKYGETTFRHARIWDVDWEAIRQAGLKMGIGDLPERPIKDPRSYSDRWLLRLLQVSQGTSWQRPVNAITRRLGW